MGVSPEITKLIALGDECQVFFFCISAQPEFGMIISGNIKDVETILLRCEIAAELGAIVVSILLELKLIDDLGLVKGVVLVFVGALELFNRGNLFRIKEYLP